MSQRRSYAIVDTNQTTFYNNTSVISAPSAGQDFYGQDATYTGTKASYVGNSDGTVSDQATGLVWSQPSSSAMTWSAALSYADSSTYGGYDDWRLPTVKELYSLIQFSGYTGTSSSTSSPYIDSGVFNFSYSSSGSRLIDSQYWSSTQYTGTTINGDSSAFGVNFADGRIKAYSISTQTAKSATVILVRGNTSYGVNSFHDNGDGTITDDATGLMWSWSDSGYGMNWQSALSYAENSTLAGYSDWFLPDAKQLQSIVDYSQSPYATNSANVGPAIDDRYFHLTNTGSTSNQDYGYYWSSTTHVEGGTGDYAVYIAFGTAWGYTNNRWQDVHGAGAQRSDPKAQDGSYPVYNGPQGDYLSISNYALIARQVADDVSRTGSTGADQLSGDTGNDLLRGGPGNDSEVGASGHDTLFGGIGADTLNGGAGADLLYGNAGRDLIDGGAGSDTVYAGADDDTVYGGNYSDYLSGDKGNDLLYGGDDADVFLFNSANFGADTIGDFTISQKDRLALSSGATWSVASDALGDAVITISTGGSVTLKGVASTSVSSDLFLTL